ncbi:MAG TPA: F-box protein, partial [Ignavibacteriaceae bacterium]
MDVSLTHLPPELLAEIFSYLSTKDLARNICLVSHQFKDISQNSSLWTNLEIKSNKLNAKTASSLFARCFLLKKLELMWHPTPIYIQALNVCHRLQCLKVVVDDDITDLMEAIHGAPAMRELSLKGFWNPKQLSERAECLAQLTHIKLQHYNTLMDTKSLIAIGEHCKNLKELRLCT